MSHVIAILEDNDDRVAAFRACLADRYPQHELYVTDDPPTLIDFLARRWSEVALVSLDRHRLVSRGPECPAAGRTGRLRFAVPCARVP